MFIFQSTPSVWRETRDPDPIFLQRLFQSTPSVWRETSFAAVISLARQISIHSLRVEGDTLLSGFLYPVCISIHSLRVEGDSKKWLTRQSSNYFNPLPPCGGRQSICGKSYRIFVFQSTPSVWRETIDFTTFKGLYGISIHSLRVEGDPLAPILFGCFQISIHSLRVEGDILCIQIPPVQSDFNPLPPCGGRRFSITKDGEWIPFQSTPSVWRETAAASGSVSYTANFNPLPPCGGRRQ